MSSEITIAILIAALALALLSFFMAKKTKGSWKTVDSSMAWGHVFVSAGGDPDDQSSDGRG